MTRSFLPMLFLAGVAGAASAASPAESDVDMTGALNVPAAAATYRYLFANNSSALQAKAPTFCIDMPTTAGPANPPAALLATLRKTTPKVAPQSSCKMTTHVTDAAGNPALTFSLNQVHCVSARECLFYGGYLEGNMSASSGRYRARLIRGRWQVRVEGPIAVS